MRSVAHFVDVAGADALLYVGEALALGVGLAHEVGHQRVHARRGEEHGGVVFGNERSAGDDGVPLGLEELEVELAELVGFDVAHGVFSFF